MGIPTVPQLAWLSSTVVSGETLTPPPAGRDMPRKVYCVLRRAVSCLEGSDEAESYAFLRLLLQSSPGSGWAASYCRTSAAIV